MAKNLVVLLDKSVFECRLSSPDCKPQEGRCPDLFVAEFQESTVPDTW